MISVERQAVSMSSIVNNFNVAIFLATVKFRCDECQTLHDGPAH